MAMDSSHAASPAAHAPGEGHATVQTYIRVAVVLGILTAIEIGALYVPGLPSHILVTLLLVFSVVKFGLVVAFFMHLRYDNKVLTALFVGPLLIAMIIILALMALFGSYLLLARG
jgi:cytochrome c oxidase subunit 4